MKQPPSKNGDGTGTSRLTGNARGELERHILESVKGTDRLILRELFGFLRGKAVCWPGNEAIGKEAGVSRSTIQRALNALEDAGVLKTVDDSSTRSRRRIVLLAHPDAAAELARLEASPHTRFDRCRDCAPISDKRNGRVSNCYPEPGQNDTPEGIKLTPKTVEPLSAKLESPNSRERTGGEKTLPNGERKTPVMAGPMSDFMIRTKAMADTGDPIAKAQFEAMCRELAMAAAPDEQIITDALGGAPASPLEFLERLRPGAPPIVYDQAVEVLCRTLGATDARDYRRAYQKAVNQVRKGVLSASVVVHAFEQASQPSARNPGRVFAHNVNHRKGLQC